jgi:hypothetical protein
LDALKIYADYRIANYDPVNPDTLRIFLAYHNVYNTQPYGVDPYKQEEYFQLYWPDLGPSFLSPTITYDCNENDIPQKGSVVRPRANSLRTIDYILGTKDSFNLDPTNQYGYSVINVGQINEGEAIDLADYGGYYEVPVGSVMSVMMKFIPGYDYNLDDTIKKIYYNASTEKRTDLVLEKNTFEMAILYDTNFINFCDMGGGFNTRLYEDKSIRYNKYTYFTKDKNGNLPSWNTYGYSAYGPTWEGIPYIGMGFSVEDEFHELYGVTEANAVVSKIYPNPANDLLKIELINSGEAELTVMNTVGQVVKTVTLNEMNNAVDISALSSGLYMLKVSQNGSVYTTKITKK